MILDHLRWNERGNGVPTPGDQEYSPALHFHPDGLPEMAARSSLMVMSRGEGQPSAGAVGVKHHTQRRQCVTVSPVKHVHTAPFRFDQPPVAQLGEVMADLGQPESGGEIAAVRT